MDSQGVFDSARIARSPALEVGMRAPWCCVVAPSNDTYLYVVRSGQCLLESDDLEAPLVLEAGDIVTLVGANVTLGVTRRRRRPAHPRWICPGSGEAGGPAAASWGRAGLRLLIMSAPRDSNQFISVYPALVAIPRTARESHGFLQRVIRLIEMELAADRLEGIGGTPARRVGRHRVGPVRPAEIAARRPELARGV